MSETVQFVICFWQVSFEKASSSL